MRQKKDSFLFFSERLRYLRDSNGLTQVELSKQLKMAGINITEDMISSFERGITEPKLSQIAAICKFFDVTPNFLFGYTQFSSNDINAPSNNLEFSLSENNISISDCIKFLEILQQILKDVI